MAIHFGTIKEFRPESDTIKAYLEQVKLYFTDNDVAREKQIPILLSSIGAPTYALLNDLFALNEPVPGSYLWETAQPLWAQAICDRWTFLFPRT